MDLNLKIKATGKRRLIAATRTVAAVLVAASVVAYGGLVLFGLFCSDAVIFKPPAASYSATTSGIMTLKTSAGDIAALWLPKEGAKTAILYFHGNSHDLGRVAKRMAFLRDSTGCAVFAVDYPGYGLSEGKPSEAGTFVSADAGFAKLSGDLGFAPENIVLWGTSLGTGPAVDLAARHVVRGVILEAPFTSTFRTVTRIKLVPFDKFDNLSKIAGVRSPLLIIHGDKDRVVPFAEGKELSEAAVNAPVNVFIPVPGAGHELAAIDDRLAHHKDAILKIIERK